MGIPKYHLRVVYGVTRLISSCFLFRAISFNSHVQIYVSSPDILLVTSSKGLWSFPASATVTGGARQMPMCCDTCQPPLPVG